MREFFGISCWDCWRNTFNDTSRNFSWYSSRKSTWSSSWNLSPVTRPRVSPNMDSARDFSKKKNPAINHLVIFFQDTFRSRDTFKYSQGMTDGTLPEILLDSPHKISPWIPPEIPPVVVLEIFFKDSSRNYYWDFCKDSFESGFCIPTGNPLEFVLRNYCWDFFETTTGIPLGIFNRNSPDFLSFPCWGCSRNS